MSRLLTPVSVALLLIVGAGGMTGALLAPAPRAGAERANGYKPDKQECAFLKDINEFRQKNNKGELTLSATLGAAADHHSEDMAENNYWNDNHKLSDGTTAEQNIRNHGYDDPTWGENIAAGNAKASKTFDQWENSAPHRRNMLNGAFEAIGIGRAKNPRSDYGWYWTTTFGGSVDDRVRC